MGKKSFFWGIFIIAASGILAGFLSVSAETNISSTSTDYLAWEDTDGWWDFYNTGNVYVWSTKIVGYASSTAGGISLDCATSPGGDICSTSNYGICNGPGPHNTDGTCPNGDASGILTGYAWNDTIGWISFNCNQSSHGGSNNCASSNYKVEIGGDGDWTGYAWNDIVGWISFNCSNNSSCGVLEYRVNTSWRATSTLGYLTSSVFDTGVETGAVLNSILWQGAEEGSGTGSTCVGFQAAASDSPSGPWNYIGPSGDDTTYYGASCETSPNGGVGCAPADTAICVNRSELEGYRYFRYRMKLQSNLLQTKTPRVDDVILNWSP